MGKHWNLLLSVISLKKLDTADSKLGLVTYLYFYGCFILSWEDIFSLPLLIEQLKLQEQ